MTHPRCWQCGVEPTGVVELRTFDHDTPVRVVPTGWPPADHPHALTPPTPEELVAEGHRILRRILEDAWSTGNSSAADAPDAAHSRAAPADCTGTT